jgi:serine/threonine-protein kinase HipA
MALRSLDVRLDGFDRPVGDLRSDDNGAVSFVYRQGYLADPAAMPLSLSLPLDEAPFGDAKARSFFDNLLQERDGALTSIMAREGIARDDIVGLLTHLGRDCAGAISVLPPGAPPVKLPGDYEQDYTPLSDARIEDIVQSLHRRRRLPDGSNDPSPLAGMQSKVALTVLPDGRLAEPNPGSGAPTTHILKVPDPDHPADARLEAQALGLSRALGFATADALVVPVAGVDTLLVTRFDRARDSDGRVVRLHQEDFAQALGLPPALKYQRRGIEGRRYDAQAIRRLLDAVDDPALARDTFIRATVFDLLVGNTDGHAKNFALLHGPGRHFGLAPRYDVLPTRLDPALTDELAFSIGSATTIDDITDQDFAGFLADLGISSAAARRRLAARVVSETAAGLASRIKAVEEAGHKPFADLIAAHSRILLPALGLVVPAAMTDRDAFVSRGGGWLLS